MTINFREIIGQAAILDLYDSGDWIEWRYCYDGGRLFREKYLEKFSDREEQAEYERRRSLTPIPSFAQKEINRVKNSVAIRFPDISRRDGSKIWQDAIAGKNKGVNRRGASMNSYLNKIILPDLLVMGEVGTLVTAPEVNGSLKSDVPDNFRPYLIPFAREDYITEPAPLDSPSDFASVLLTERKTIAGTFGGFTNQVKSFKYFWLNEARGGLVSVQNVNEQGVSIGGQIDTDLDSVPFVKFNVLESLMRKVCAHQIALLNMISADSSYAIDSNYSFLIRQRGNNNAAAHLIGEEDEVEVGPKKGLFYDKSLNPPAFISPPSEPLQWSLELRRELKMEIQELVSGTITGMGEDGSLEAGLAFIGSCLQDGEVRCWDHWTTYESAEPSTRKIPVVDYPDSWSIKTDEERLEEANKLIALVNNLTGTEGKKQANKMIYDKLFRGKVSTEDLAKMKKAVDDAPFTTSDPTIVKMAAEMHLAGPQTLSVSLGYDENEYLEAQKEQDRRAANIVAAQADAAAGAARGVPDGSVDPESNKLAREGEANKDSNLDDGPGERGEGDEPKEDDE